MAFIAASVVVVSKASVVRMEYGSTGGIVSTQSWPGLQSSWPPVRAPL